VNDSSASAQHAPWSTLWPILAILGLILLAFALRVYRLPAQNLWYDEGVSWYLTGMPLRALTEWTANDIQPPLFYYLLWLWARLAGTCEYALRFPSVIFGTLTVPLIWTTGWRLLGKRAAWLAALMLVISPLHVYYAQEARMYTLLTFLGLLSSYLLLRLTAGPTARDDAQTTRATTWGRPYNPYVWAYVLAIVAALYVHYFAFFLLAAHALYVLYLWRGQSRNSYSLNPSLAVSITISITVAILYLPWLPFLLTRYGVDTSYWPGALKLGEVARKLFLAFGLGETVKESVGIWLAVGYGLILLISLVALIVNERRRKGKEGRLIAGSSSPIPRYPLPPNLVFLLLYLFVPLVLVLLLVQRTPKFNPRYAMLASPAFILLIAGGLASLFSHHASRVTHSPKGTYRHVSRFTFHVLRFISIASLIFILLISIYSLRNWYAPYRVNQFNKADFRITAQIVRERIGVDETALLNSGHMFPAWAYYYGWKDWQRLPDIETLDVNAALDLSVGDELDLLLRGKRGTWLVRWQNEVTDPFDVLPLYLGSVGVQDDYGQFWHMELFHYQLPPDARFDLDSFITQPTDADFGDRVRLLGMRQVSGTELVLFWQAMEVMEADYTIFVHLLDADGVTLVNADHLPPRPTREWRPGQAIPDRVTFALPSDLPPGDYWIAVGLYDAGDPTLSRLPLSDGSGDRVMLPLHLEADDLE
jgi:mannosyltransferase